MITENKIYNPAAQPKQWLIEHFVVRTKVFEKIFKDIQSGKMKYPEQHYLIQGQRGMGKTTLLLRLKYEIENTPSLNSWLVPVFFNEESYDLLTLSNLWEKLLKYLDDLWQTGGMYYNKTDEFVGKPDYEEKCFDYLQQVLKEQRKKLVIFFDNFGQLFLDNLKDKEQRRLREILMSCADLRFIGASAIVLKDLHDYSKPFFEFFKIINLEGLSKTETFDLIKKLTEKSGADIDLEKNKAKIETLAILTGGVIRTIMLVYEAILADQDGTALRDLEMILDRITPLYKHRIEDLPVQQRRIVDVIAKNWDAISAKDIAANIREDGKYLATKIISAQLQQLEKNNVIEKKQTTTKNHLYQLKERFFNIWYLMRLGDRKDKCRVIWLTKFLEMWYEDNLDEFLREHLKHLQTGKYHSNSAVMMANALAASSKINIQNQQLLIEETAKILNDEEKKLLPNLTQRKLKEVKDLFAQGRNIEALIILDTLEQSNNVLQLKVLCYLNLEKLKNAWDILLDLEDSEPLKPFLLAQYYNRTNEFDQELSYLKHVLNNSNFKEIKNTIADRIGDIYAEDLLDLKEAIKYYSISQKQSSEHAYLKMGHRYIQLREFVKAEEYFSEAVKMGSISARKALHLIYIFYKPDEEKANEIIARSIAEFPEDPEFKYFAGAQQKFNNNIQGAKEYLKTAIKQYQETNIYGRGFETACAMLADIYMDEKNKKLAVKYLQLIDPDKAQSIVLLVSSQIFIWSNNFEKGVGLANKYIATLNPNTIEKQLQELQNLFLLLMCKRQFHAVLKIFQHPEIPFKEFLKPLYYSLMHYLKDQYPNEIVKMGEELRQPVEDIMKRVEEMAIEYQ